MAKMRVGPTRRSAAPGRDQRQPDMLLLAFRRLSESVNNEQKAGEYFQDCVSVGNVCDITNVPVSHHSLITERLMRIQHKHDIQSPPPQ